MNELSHDESSNINVGGTVEDDDLYWQDFNQIGVVVRDSD